MPRTRCGLIPVFSFCVVILNEFDTDVGSVWSYIRNQSFALPSTCAWTKGLAPHLFFICKTDRGAPAVRKNHCEGLSQRDDAELKPVVSVDMANASSGHI